MEQTSPEELITCYMLPEQIEEGGRSGLVDYSLNEYSRAKYPIATNKKKRKSSQKKESKKKKTKAGKTVQFHSKAIIKTIHSKRKSDLTEIELTNEEDYPMRNSEFVVKHKQLKQWMKLHHQQRPLTPKRLRIQNTIKRENGNA